MADTVGSLSSAPPQAGFLTDLADLYFAPRAAFERIAARPRVWIPLLLMVVFLAVAMGIWVYNIDVVEFMRAQAERSHRPPPPAGRIPGGFVKGVILASGAVAPPVVMLALAGLFMVVFNFVLAAEVRFRQSLSIVLHSFLAVMLVSMPLSLLVMGLKHEWSGHLGEALQANLSLLFERESTPKALYSLAESLDLFSAWTAALLAAGYRAATRRPALWPILVLWLVWVLIRAGLAALFG